LQGFYLKVVPITDQWGNPIQAGTRSACGTVGGWGIAYADSSPFGNDDFVIGSFGRDGDGPDPDAYNPSNPSAGLYSVSSMQDFNNDIVMWNGSMVIGPRTAASGS